MNLRKWQPTGLCACLAVWLSFGIVAVDTLGKWAAKVQLGKKQQPKNHVQIVKRCENEDDVTSGDETKHRLYFGEMKGPCNLSWLVEFWTPRRHRLVWRPEATFCCFLKILKNTDDQVNTQVCVCGSKKRRNTYLPPTLPFSVLSTLLLHFSKSCSGLCSDHGGGMRLLVTIRLLSFVQSNTNDPTRAINVRIINEWYSANVAPWHSGQCVSHELLHKERY